MVFISLFVLCAVPALVWADAVPDPAAKTPAKTHAKKMKSKHAKSGVHKEILNRVDNIMRLSSNEPVAVKNDE